MMKRLPNTLALIFFAGAVAFGQVAFSQSEEESATERSEADEEASESAEKDLPSAEDVMKKLDDLYRANSSKATMVMTVEKPRGTRELELESWSKGDEKALIVIRKPAREAGTATLRTPDGLWNYAPRADRLIRIPSGLLSDSWMGSHFTNDDLMRETRYDDDYNGEVSIGEYEGDAVYKLTLKPKPDAPVVYSKLVFYVTKEDWVPRATEYYDKGDVVRKMAFSDVEKIDGKKVPMVMTMQPTDAEDEMTKVKYKELKFDVKVKEALFSRRGLRRVAK